MKTDFEVNMDQNANEEVQEKNIQNISLLEVMGTVNPQDDEDLIQDPVDEYITRLESHSIRTKIVTFYRQQAHISYHLGSAMCALLSSYFGVKAIHDEELFEWVAPLYWAHVFFNVLIKSEPMKKSFIGKLGPYVAAMCLIGTNIIYHDYHLQMNICSLFIFVGSFFNIWVFSHSFVNVSQSSASPFYQNVFLPLALLANAFLFLGFMLEEVKIKGDRVKFIVNSSHFFIQVGFMAFFIHAILFAWSVLVWQGDNLFEHAIQTRFSSLFPPHELSAQTRTVDNKKLYDLMNAACMLLFVMYQWIIPNDNNVYGGFKVSTVFYWAHTIFNLKKTSIQKPIYGLIGLYGSCLYLIGSFFFYESESDQIKVCRLFWTFGSFFNICFISIYIYKLSQIPVRPLYLSFSLPLAWVANVLFFSGSALTGRNYEFFNFVTIGCFVFPLSTILFLLSIWYGDILYECFVDENLLAVIDQERGDDVVCRLRKGDIVNIMKILCLFLMSIFHAIEPGICWIIGSVFNLAYEILDNRQRHPNGTLGLGTIGVFGGIMWCISSPFSLSIISSVYDGDQGALFVIQIWGPFWMIGNFCNLVVVSGDIIESVYRGRAKRPLFRILFLLSTLAANISCNIGASLLLCTRNTGVIFMVIGFILFFIRSVFFTLSVLCGHIVFKIISSSMIVSEDRQSLETLRECSKSLD